MYMFDTNTVSHLFRQHPQVLNVMEKLRLLPYVFPASRKRNCFTVWLNGGTRRCKAWSRPFLPR